MRTELIEKVKNILKGIDLDEVSDTNGWWETSSGAEFGAKKLNEVIKAIQALSEEKVVSADFESALTYELSKLPYTKHLDDGQYNDGQINGFEMGARWMHDYAQQPSETPPIANVLLAEVAVLSCSRKRFDNWVRENAQWQEKYICVMSERDILGRVFKRVEKSFEWFRIENADEVEKATLLRCR